MINRPPTQSPTPEPRAGMAAGAAPAHRFWPARRPLADYSDMLRRVGLRTTRQRIVLARLLFANGHRHVTANELHDEALKVQAPMPLATIYNTLNHFTEAGLLRRIGVSACVAFFDTNPSRHHHFYFEDSHALVDIPPGHVLIGRLPLVPEGCEIAGVDVVVRLRRRRA